MLTACQSDPKLLANSKHPTPQITKDCAIRTIFEKFVSHNFADVNLGCHSISFPLSDKLVAVELCSRADLRLIFCIRGRGRSCPSLPAAPALDNLCPRTKYNLCCIYYQLSDFKVPIRALPPFRARCFL